MVQKGDVHAMLAVVSAALTLGICIGSMGPMNNFHESILPKENTTTTSAPGNMNPPTTDAPMMSTTTAAPRSSSTMPPTSPAPTTTLPGARATDSNQTTTERPWSPNTTTTMAPTTAAPVGGEYAPQKFSKLMNSVLSSIHVVGFFLGTLLIANPALTRLGRKKTLLVSGVLGLVGAAILTIGWHFQSNAAFLIGRFILGLPGGIVSVAGNLYVEETASPENKTTIGVFFQIGVTFGILLAALCILPFSSPVEMNPTIGQFQYYQLLYWASSFLLTVVACIVPETERWQQLQGAKQDEKAGLQGGNINRGTIAAGADEYEDPKHTECGALTKSLIFAFIIACSIQMTGINAIMTYGGPVAKGVGIPHAMVGNAVIMVWNFVTTLVSIPLSRRVSMRKLYMVGVVCASLACLMTGIFSNTWVSNAGVKTTFSAIGIALFIAAFEIGMGPAFYVLAQEMFPPSFKEKGSTFTNTVCLFFNIVINFTFPYAQESFSTLSPIFFFFGGLGLVSGIVLLLMMPKTHGEQEKIDDDIDDEYHGRSTGRD